MEFVQQLVSGASGLNRDLAWVVTEYYGCIVPHQVVQWPFYGDDPDHRGPSAWILPENVTALVYGLTAQAYYASR